MSQRCSHRRPDGSSCKRWASSGSPFCYRHQPPPEKLAEPENSENLSPLDRLASHDDLFDVVRETLNAIRLGRISPGRAYATGYFIDLWMRVRERMEKAGPETTKFRKRRVMSNPVEQAMFDVVAEKVVQMMTGSTPQEIEKNAGAPAIPFDERAYGPEHPAAAAFFPEESPWMKRQQRVPCPGQPPIYVPRQRGNPSPKPLSEEPAAPVPPAPAAPPTGLEERTETIPLPKNWGYEGKKGQE